MNINIFIVFKININSKNILLKSISNTKKGFLVSLEVIIDKL